MKNNKKVIGNKEEEKASSRERLALVLSGGENEKSVKQASAHVGWMELRVDGFLKRGEKFPPSYLPLPALRIIGTVRWVDESQEAGIDISEEERLEIYRDVIPHVDLVDVEARSRIAGQVLQEAKKQGRGTILSYHDFSGTPSIETLEEMYGICGALGSDMVKIASMVRSRDDLFTLLSFTHRHARDNRLIVAPMGVSAVERFMPLFLGSLFTYVCLDRPTAPGQPSLVMARKILQGLMS
jgi:3-dehydroquinate dehydratase-1